MPRKLSQFLFLVLFFFSIPAFAENQVKNPDMEDGQPIGWTAYASSPNQAIYATDNFHSATRALKIVNSLSGISYWKSDQVNFSGALSKKINLSAWVKAKDISSSANVLLSLFVTYQDNSTQSFSDLKFSSGTYNWTKQQFTRSFKKNVKSFRLYLYFTNGTGSVWLDDLSVTTITSKNFMPNPNLELGKPKHWISFASSPNQAVYAADSFHSGSRSLKITNSTSNTSYWMAEKIDFSPPYPKEFSCSAWAKGQNISKNSQVMLYLSLIFEDNTMQAYYADTQFPTGTFNWREKKASKAFTKGIKSIIPYLYFLQGKGTVWFDDISLSAAANLIPQITNITPADDSEILSGAKVNITTTAVDDDNDPLEYQFSIAGSVKQSWSSANTYAWQTSESDVGLSSVTCEVRDDKGGTASKTISLRVINPTVEKILQKVADNYALVNDKKMDVTMNSKFNNEAFGSTVYTRHYFKKPDKQRTETFSQPSRSDASKTEIQIAAGPDIYLIDPIHHAKAHQNLLTESDLTQEQLNQMDEIYHLQNFLAAHIITRIDYPDDLAKSLVMIEAVPKTANKIYSKLGIQIDYLKGIRTKSLTYAKENNQDNLKQAIEISNSQQMPNGAWVPKGQVKTLYLTDGNLIMTSTFENVQVNVGLSDYLFDPEKE